MFLSKGRKAKFCALTLRPSNLGRKTKQGRKKGRKKSFAPLLQKPSNLLFLFTFFK
jgi:hypothetical protein